MSFATLTLVLVPAVLLVVTRARTARALPGDPLPADDYADACPVGGEMADTAEAGDVAADVDAEGEAPDCIDITGTEIMPPSAIELRAAGTGAVHPLDVLPLRLIEPTVEDAVSQYYAKVVVPDAPIYNAPAGQIIGSTGTGFIFYSTQGSQEAGGELWTRVNAGEWIRQSDLRWRNPSSFKGVYIDDWPEREFAWMLDPNQPLLTPGGEPNKAANFLERYQMVTLYATAWVDGWRYYLIAPDQWVRETWLGKVIIQPVPEGVEGRWFDIDLYEQTLVAYEDERPVYATLVSSGLEQWSTTEGVFRVWYRAANAPMSGAHGEPDYYYLENVPWSLYFNESAAIHGAYWHDGFGYRRSHGCVNVAPADALWMFNWADEGTWVHVYSSAEYR